MFQGDMLHARVPGLRPGATKEHVSTLFHSNRTILSLFAEKYVSDTYVAHASTGAAPRVPLLSILALYRIQIGPL